MLKADSIITETNTKQATNSGAHLPLILTHCFEELKQFWSME